MVEKEVQRYAVELLKHLGCRVLSTSQTRRSKVSLGLPDLFARRDKWPVGVWFAIEMKGDKTLMKPEQLELQRTGGIYVCRGMESVEKLQSVIMDFESSISKRFA